MHVAMQRSAVSISSRESNATPLRTPQSTTPRRVRRIGTCSAGDLVAGGVIQNTRALFDGWPSRHQCPRIDIKNRKMHHKSMRTTLALEDDAFTAIQAYAKNRGVRGKAASELVRKGAQYRLGVRKVNGLPAFDAPDEFPLITTDLVREGVGGRRRSPARISAAGKLTPGTHVELRHF